MPFVSKILSFCLLALSPLSLFNSLQLAASYFHLLYERWHVSSARNIPTGPPAYQPPFDVQFTGTRTGMDLRTELLTLSTEWSLLLLPLDNKAVYQD